MFEIGMAMSKIDVKSLQETLYVQEQLIEKLYNELDEESEASASAASEALSMILRLQGEKAAEEMEAEQYKRFVEEKMCHADESLSIFQDLINQKEMEIVALDYQTQAYRYKLLSIGCDDIEFNEDLFHKNESFDQEMSVQAIGRCKSAPNIPQKYANQIKGILDKDEYISQERDLNDTSMDGSIDLYCEKIEQLEERVKQIAGANYAKSCSSEMRSHLPLSKRNYCNNFLDVYQVKHRGNKSDNGTSVRSASPPKVLDVFEVPRAIKDDDKMIWQSDERVEKQDFVPKEAAKQLVKDQTDCLKKYLVPMQHENKLHKVGEAAAVDCHLAICATTSASETEEIRRLNRTFEIAEVEVQGTRQESDRYEELMLLHDIKEQINLMQSEIRSWKNKKSPTRDELSVVSLTEVMVCFWL
ncbi:uncharacterized protein LOC107805724 [Nicotiana tabacum]|uniref:Uncharacterized protein LOC107805724 n=1 Tax=Nicotiana tabacum TaxID=4097 RepID=A0A1S4B8M5_TOBAC|nr:PREDICTED: uncharacterized protein LOC107805724 [Nicotiana tabacum]